jgi:polysaccharide export outer membrane protein
MLSVVVLNHPELSSSDSNKISLVQPGQENNQYLSNSNSNNATQEVGYYVDTQGEIVFPLIGKVQVAGLTTQQASQKITIKLAKYIRSPMVSLKVTKFNSQRVHVLGEVMQPGIRPIGDRALSILDALSLAGGINSQTADMRHVFVLRSKDQNNILVYWLDSKSPAALLLAEHFRLLDNDIVYIPPAGVTDWNRFLNQILPTVQTYWYTRSLVRN